MKTSQRGIDLIKSFEGFSGTAIKLQGEQFWTWGYGHYGSDVPANGKITKVEAETLLRKDLESFEKNVESICDAKAKFKPNQNQFDALVSFTYNCGAGCLMQLVMGRNAEQVAQHITAYTNSSSEIYRAGLLNRRKKELSLFLEKIPEPKKKKDDEMVEKIKMIVNGKSIEVERIYKNDTNYIKIRDIAEALGMDVDWDRKTSAPILTSK